MNEVNKPDFWEGRYQAQNTSWDLGRPTPVFKTIASKYPTGKLCIIGCGRGYDAVVFAENGFDVTAIDFSETAIKDVHQLAAKSDVHITGVCKDIFDLPIEFLNTFDYVIEQTCFYAIDPERRSEYETVVHSILKPHGQLIGLWFPLDKLINEGGPPWGTTEEEVKTLFSKRWIKNMEKFHEESIEPRKGREKLIIFEKI